MEINNHANFEPSPLKSENKVDEKVQRLDVEELDTNNTSKSVQQPKLNKRLRLLKMDEHLREEQFKRHYALLLFCEEHNLILDLATSDVCIYLEDSTGRFICLG